MKTLGMIGGTSWHSTIEYYRYINEIVEERQGEPPKNPPLLLYSINVDIMRRGDWYEINNAYLDISKKLEAIGADAIIICANTPHKVYPLVKPHLSIPIIHIADAIGKEAKKLNLKNLALFGTSFVMEEDYIRSRLRENFNIDTQVPESDARKEINRTIEEELTRGVFKRDTRDFYLSEMKKLKSNGTDGVIMGCTEIPMLIKEDDFDQPLLNTTYLHAISAVEFILS